jgi:hypothetical protein
MENQRKDAEADLWNQASQLSSSQQKLEFISANSGAQAVAFLMLQTSRQLLDEGKFAESEALASQFVSKYSSHPRLSSAFLIRAYAREEQGELDGARSDYQAVQGMEEKVNRLLSTKALERLL